MSKKELKQHLSELYVIKALAEKFGDIERLSTIDDEIAESTELYEKIA